MKKLAILAVLALAACGSTRTNIASLEVALTAADTAALAYVDLPVCGTVPAGQPCSTPDIIAKIGIAEGTAFTAVKAAEVAQDSTSVQKAQESIAALQTIITTIAGGK